MMTTYERGMLAERRASVLRLLEAKFGALSPTVKERVEALSPDESLMVLVEILKAESLKDLRLAD